MNTPLNYTCFDATYVQREKFLGLFMTGFPQREALSDQCNRMGTQVVKVCLTAWERRLESASFWDITNTETLR
jgi:hypothetical protein